MIDSHAHLYFDRFDDDRDEVIQRAREAGVDRLINIGIDEASSRQAIDLAERHEGFFAAVGLHPTSPVNDLEKSVGEVRRLARENPRTVVAIGEIGLDFYWKDVTPEEQGPRLRAQLELARELGLPVIFHCRDALEELLSCLEAEEARPPGVFHCFSGGRDEAERALGLGYHVSFAGNVTYPKARDLQEAAGAVPVDRLLLETDSPFLPPQPRRGRRNEPAFVRYSRDFLAELKGLPPEELERRTVANTERLFRLTR
ncbi:MAG: TatD family hydrolase [Planctomycetota bacterium]|nr:TatD family hydrolase [Planctomycetota bacterium]